jgi:hypothetical protein
MFSATTRMQIMEWKKSSSASGTLQMVCNREIMFQVALGFGLRDVSQ